MRGACIADHLRLASLLHLLSQPLELLLLNA